MARQSHLSDKVRAIVLMVQSRYSGALAAFTRIVRMSNPTNSVYFLSSIKILSIRKRIKIKVYSVIIINLLKFK